jgi:hypothetical protein
MTQTLQECYKDEILYTKAKLLCKCNQDEKNCAISESEKYPITKY